MTRLHEATLSGWGEAGWSRTSSLNAPGGMGEGERPLRVVLAALRRMLLPHLRYRPPRTRCIPDPAGTEGFCWGGPDQGSGDEFGLSTPLFSFSGFFSSYKRPSWPPAADCESAWSFSSHITTLFSPAIPSRSGLLTLILPLISCVSVARSSNTRAARRSYLYPD